MYDFKNVFYFHATLDLEGVILDIGGKILQDAELEKSNLIGQHFTQLSFWKLNEYILQDVESAIKTAAIGNPFEIETTLQINRSKISVLRAKFTPIFNENKEVEKIIFSSTDVSEYVREIDFHKRRVERFLLAAECAEVGLWFWDLKNIEIYTTPLCNKLCGLAPDEIMTFDKFTEIIAPEDRILVIEALNQSQAEVSEYNIECQLNSNSNSNSACWISVRGKTIAEDNESKIMMGSVRDITHRKVSSQKLQKLYELEKVARDEIEEINLQKDHFLALVSHELRSPIQTISGWSKILLSQDVDEETHRKALETIERNANLQAKLISDLVDSAKIIAGKLDFSVQNLNLGNLVNSIFQSQKPIAEDKEISLVLGNIQNLEILGDSGRLQQAISNLLSNALKFTNTNGVVLIELNEENGHAVLNVTDSGTGISPEELPFIFKQYYQAQSSQNKTGLGLGLSIVKAIVEKHGGQASVRNNDNGIGCTFSIKLPINQNGKTILKKVSTIENRDNKLNHISILIVEDNVDSLEVLQFYLTKLGATVISAHSAQEGLNCLNFTHSLPKIIISDISMPFEDGYSFIKKVRNSPNEQINKIPAIALTAFVSNNEEEKVKAAGFQTYHSKPFEPNLLVSQILELVEKQ